MLTIHARNGTPMARLRNLVHAFHQANVAEPELPRILQYESIRGGERLEYVFQHYLVPFATPSHHWCRASCNKVGCGRSRSM